MKWTETNIARALATQFFNRKYLMVLPNCSWPGSECDVLCITENLRIIDVEIKISRGDLRADAKKGKWWGHEEMWWSPDRVGPPKPRLPREWPRNVWKHYYAMPKEIWTPDLLECLPSTSSGIILLSDGDYGVQVGIERRAVPCRDAKAISAASAIDIARLASLRMWDTFKRLEEIAA